MWDEEDGFYYDVLRLPDGRSTRLKVRSMVGLLPLAATTVVEKWQRERVPRVTAAIQERLRRMPELAATMHATGPGQFGVAERGLLALVNQDRLRRILSKMLDENEFLGPHGIRALSKFHERHPYTFNVDGQEHRVDYLPAESNNGMFGGNSNWRGPVWMPVNVILIRALLNYFTVLRRQLQGGMPDGLRQDDESLRGRQGHRRPTRGDLPQGRVRATAGLRRHEDVPGGPALARLPPLLRVFPRRQRRGPGRQPPDGMDGRGRVADSALWHARRGNAARGRQERRLHSWNVPGELTWARRDIPETDDATKELGIAQE